MSDVLQGRKIEQMKILSHTRELNERGTLCVHKVVELDVRQYKGGRLAFKFDDADFEQAFPYQYRRNSKFSRRWALNQIKEGMRVVARNVASNAVKSTKALECGIYVSYWIAYSLRVYLNFDLVKNLDLFNKIEFEKIKRGAEKGNPEDMRKLGFEYKEGMLVQKDLVEAKKWLEKAAEKGEAIARAELLVEMIEKKSEKRVDKSIN